MALKAKKLDLDFDALGTSPPPEGYGTQGEEEEQRSAGPERTQSQSVPGKPWKPSPKPASSATPKLDSNSDAASSPTQKEKEKERPKPTKMQGISSTDYEYARPSNCCRAQQETNPEVVKERQQRFAHAKAISSTDYYGTSAPTAESPDVAPSRLANAKDIGWALLDSAKEKAAGVPSCFLP